MEKKSVTKPRVPCYRLCNMYLPTYVQRKKYRWMNYVCPVSWWRICRCANVRSGSAVRYVSVTGTMCHGERTEE